PAPSGGAKRCEAVGMAGLDQRFGPSVPSLLLQVGLGAGTPVVPDERSGVEADLPSLVEHLPAQVHVVAGRHVDGIEAAGLVNRVPPETHVAAGDVLGAVVGYQDMDGAAGGACNALGGKRLAGR